MENSYSDALLHSFSANKSNLAVQGSDVVCLHCSKCLCKWFKKNIFLVVRGAKGVMMALRLKKFNYTETKLHINMDPKKGAAAKSNTIFNKYLSSVMASKEKTEAGT